MPTDNSSKSPGRVYLSEPIIVSGKSFLIKPLSAYDFILCEAMYRKLSDTLISQNEGVDVSLCENISQAACIVSMCLYNKQNEKVFSCALEALKNLTPKELKKIHLEYVNLSKKTARLDAITYKILEKVKNDNYVSRLESLYAQNVWN